MTTKIDLRIGDINGLLRRVDPVRGRKALIAGMNAVGIEGEGDIKQETAADRGRLAAGWNHEVRVVAGGYVTVIGNNIFYGPYVNFGTGVFAGRGLIRPKQAKALRFVVNGQVVFRKWVRGQRAQAFVETGLFLTSFKIPRIFARTVQRFLDGR